MQYLQKDLQRILEQWWDKRPLARTRLFRFRKCRVRGESNSELYGLCTPQILKDLSEQEIRMLHNEQRLEPMSFFHGRTRRTLTDLGVVDWLRLRDRDNKRLEDAEARAIRLLDPDRHPHQHALQTDASPVHELYVHTPSGGFGHIVCDKFSPIGPSEPLHALCAYLCAMLQHASVCHFVYMKGSQEKTRPPYATSAARLHISRRSCWQLRL